MLFGALFLGVLLPQAFSEHVSFEGYRVFTVTLFSKDRIPLLRQLEEQIPLDFWKEAGKINNPRGPRLRPIYEADVMVAPGDISTAEAFFKQHSLPYQVKVENVEELFAAERKEMQQQKGTRAINWTQYHRYNVIVEWLEEIVSQNSDIATITTIGTSSEGRPLKLVKVSKPNSPANKTAVLIDGGFHAREWISPAVATYSLNQVLTNRTVNAAVLDNVDLYFIPVINPDGYEYTHTTNRNWRKTRRDHDSPLACVGVDPNRNFDFHFGGSGTSTNKCSDIYTGPEPFSEPETAALRNILLNKTINFQSYLTLHSYGQWWLTPWSWSYTLPEDYDDLMRFGNHGADALTAVHGTRYVVDATTEILGTTAGCSDDWAKAVAGIKYANTLELRDTGRYGFALPANQILPTAEETWAGIRAVLTYDFVNHRPRP
jgi:murein tripeptide amidase MpaA